MLNIETRRYKNYETIKKTSVFLPTVGLEPTTLRLKV